MNTKLLGPALSLVAMFVSPGAVVAKDTAPDVVEGLQIGVSQCTVQSPSRGLTDAFLGGAISEGVALLGKALAGAGNDKTWKLTGSRNTNGNLPDCIEVMGGKFSTAKPSADTSPGWWSASGLPADGYATLIKNGLWPKDTPDFFFEGQLVKSADGNAMAIRPVFAELYKMQGRRLTSGNTSRAVMLFFAVTKPGESPNLETAPGSTIKLGNMTVGRPVRFPADIDPSSPYDTLWFSLSDADSKKPLTISALETETQPGNHFLKFVSSVFGQPDVTTELNNKMKAVVIPSVAAASVQTEQSNNVTLENEADAKLESALGGLSACKSSGSLADAEAAREALRSYELADQKLGAPRKTVKQAMIDAIDLTKPSQVGAKCAFTYKQITGESAP